MKKVKCYQGFPIHLETKSTVTIVLPDGALVDIDKKSGWKSPHASLDLLDGGVAFKARMKSKYYKGKTCKI